ncbi:SsgA family sporulation/cell division regulator [Streptomyces sp. NPDC006283]|uniref:SsgA family sporulation/cell division regulator n=1 Tax=Streptomyces sp. NPDC006283 TaxID=3156741 RepID=UPI0033B11BA4
MRVFLGGAGGVGTAITQIATRRSFFDHMVVADYHLSRAQAPVAALETNNRFSAERIDASDKMTVTSPLHRPHRDIPLNATDLSPIAEQSVRARLISDAPHPVPILVSLRHNGDHPVAVRMVFQPESCLNGTAETWEFARSLLDSGLHAPSGSGDVRIWPCGRAHTMVELHSPEGVALLQFDRAQLRRFLLHSYATVPLDRETQAIDMDRGLDTLLCETRG